MKWKWYWYLHGIIFIYCWYLKYSNLFIHISHQCCLPLSLFLSIFLKLILTHAFIHWTTYYTNTLVGGLILLFQNVVSKPKTWGCILFFPDLRVCVGDHKDHVSFHWSHFYWYLHLIKKPTQEVHLSHHTHNSKFEEVLWTFLSF